MKRYTWTLDVSHRGKIYRAGESITLDDAEAEGLLEVGYLKEVAVAKPKAAPAEKPAKPTVPEKPGKDEPAAPPPETPAPAAAAPAK